MPRYPGLKGSCRSNPLLKSGDKVPPPRPDGVVDAANRFSDRASLYGVATKSFAGATAYPVRLHVGYGRGVYGSKIIGGGDLLISPRILLMGEYDGDKFNFGVRAGLTPEIRVELGDYDSNFGGGISYRAKF